MAINYSDEMQKIRALVWHEQPAALERLASELACALAHSRTREKQLRDKLAKKKGN